MSVLSCPLSFHSLPLHCPLLPSQSELCYSTHALRCLYFCMVKTDRSHSIKCELRLRPFSSPVKPRFFTCYSFNNARMLRQTSDFLERSKSYLLSAYFLLDSCLVYSSFLKIERIYSSGSSADFRQITRSYIAGDRTLHNHYYEKSKSHIKILSSKEYPLSALKHYLWVHAIHIKIFTTKPKIPWCFKVCFTLLNFVWQSSNRVVAQRCLPLWARY